MAVVRTQAAQELFDLMIAGVQPVFSVAAATEIVDKQGLWGLHALGSYSEKDIDDLIKNVRKPGGFAGPTAAAIAAAAAANPPTVAQPTPTVGLDVPFAGKKMLELWSYSYVARGFCGRMTTGADLTVDEAEKWRIHKQGTLKYVEPKKVLTPAVVKEFSNNWPKGFEVMRDYFRTVRGDQNKVPLGYIIRKDEGTKASADDPASNYTGVLEEMVARMPHWVYLAPVPPATAIVKIRTPYYAEDNEKVWTQLSEMFSATVEWTHIKPFMATHDGRGAFLALYDFHLGPNNTNNMARKAEDDFAKLKYTGERRRYTFENYVLGHKRIHAILADLEAVKAHKGIDEATKVRRFVDGIHNSKLDPCKTRILAEKALKTDFDAVVSLYKDFISANGLLVGNPEPSAHVAYTSNTGGSNTGGGKQHKGKKISWDGIDADVELRIHSREEWQNLSPAAKQKVKAWHAGQKAGAKREISSITREPRYSKKTTAKKAGKQSGNRNNKALVKQTTVETVESDNESME